MLTDRRNWSAEDLAVLFECFGVGGYARCGVGECREVLERLNAGEIVARQIYYEPVPIPKHTDPMRAIYIAAGGSGGEAHHDLKYQAWCWAVRVLGETHPKFEVDVVYGRADLYAPESKVVIECGVTDPSRIPRYLCDHHSWSCAYVLFPFPYADIDLSPHMDIDLLIRDGVRHSIYEIWAFTRGGEDYDWAE